MKATTKKKLLWGGVALVGLYVLGTRKNQIQSFLQQSETAVANMLTDDNENFNTPELPVEWLPEALSADAYGAYAGRYVDARRNR